MGKLVIIHFSPPELYPPLQNLLGVLEQNREGKAVLLLTSMPTNKDYAAFESKGNRVRIKRLARMGESTGSVQRGWQYFLFFTRALFYLLKSWPAKVFYYETLSSWPVYIYKRFFNGQAAVYIHYHEYSSPAEYAEGMTLNRWFHGFEAWLYPRAEWVSHTNAERMAFFLKDLEPVQVLHPEILPNYPPGSWQGGFKKESGAPLRLLYVGALSLDTMYTRELADWVLAQGGAVEWDIYTNNITEEARAFITEQDSRFTRLHAGVAYEKLPELIRQFDIGLVLYKGHLPNYVWNAPNKLYEYLACGLKVWYPQEMKGIDTVAETQGLDGLVRLNFSELKTRRVETPAFQKDSNAKLANFTCEKAMAKLLEKLDS